MNQVLADTLKKDLEGAKTNEEIMRAFALAIVAVVDCQMSMSRRVRSLWIWAIAVSIYLIFMSGNSSGLSSLLKLLGAL